MTQRLFLVSPAEWGSAAAGDVVVVTGAEAHHAVQVVRLAVGEQVLVSDGAGRRSAGEIVATQRTQLSVRLGQVEELPEPSPRFVLVQALAKGGRDEQAVEAATELGVDVVVPWQASRSIVQWRTGSTGSTGSTDKVDKSDKGRQKWVAVATAAAKQARRARIPVVEPLERLPGVCARIDAAALALVLHEDATLPLAGLDLPPSGDVVLVVGPEGGIAPEELQAFEGAGARVVRLGPEVLRSSSAGPAALAVLNAAGRWR